MVRIGREKNANPIDRLFDETRPRAVRTCAVRAHAPIDYLLRRTHLLYAVVGLYIAPSLPESELRNSP